MFISVSANEEKLPTREGRRGEEGGGGGRRGGYRKSPLEEVIFPMHITDLIRDLFVSPRK